jgi:putative transposase
MAVSVALTPGRTICWQKRRYVVVDSTGFDTIIAREVGKRRLARIPVSEARPDHTADRRAATASDLVSVDEKQWQTAVKQFAILKPLFEMDAEQRTRVHVEKVAKILSRHPATIYRWIEAHENCQRVSVLLRKGRSDRGGSRVSSEVDKIIQAAIKRIYLVAEQPQITAVIEEVNLQCFKAKLKRPGASTIRRRIASLSERLKLEKRKGKKAAARMPP